MFFSPNRTAAFIASAATLLLLAGCVETWYVATNAESFAPQRQGCELEIFSTANPDRAYIELGIIEAQGNFWKSDLEDIMPKLREQACEAGGEALIMGETDTFSDSEIGIHVQKTFATVIRWE